MCQPVESIIRIGSGGPLKRVDIMRLDGCTVRSANVIKGRGLFLNRTVYVVRPGNEGICRTQRVHSCSMVI